MHSCDNFRRSHGVSSGVFLWTDVVEHPMKGSLSSGRFATPSLRQPFTMAFGRISHIFFVTANSALCDMWVTDERADVLWMEFWWKKKFKNVFSGFFQFPLVHLMLLPFHLCHACTVYGGMGHGTTSSSFTYSEQTVMRRRA